MLNRHSQVAIPLESLFIVDYLRASQNIDRRRLFAMLVREYELEEWGVDVRASDLTEAGDAREAIEKLHDLYLAKVGKTIWGQKTPRFVRYGALLKRAWPHAKFVNVVRDPRAVVSSLIRSDVHRSNAFFAALRWLKDVTAGFDLQDRFPDDVLLVRYEDLVRDPEPVLRKVCGHLGIAYEAGMAAPKGNEMREYGSWYSQAHALLDKPPDPDRIDLWRTQLSPRQLSLIESICGEPMGRLGYDRTQPEAAINKSYVAALLADRAVGFVSQIVKAQRDRRGYLKSVARRKIAMLGVRGMILESRWSSKR
jgi:hypothetical protein